MDSSSAVDDPRQSSQGSLCPEMICSRRPAESNHSDSFQFSKDDIHDMSWFNRHRDTFRLWEEDLLPCGAEAEQGVTALGDCRRWDMDPVGEVCGEREASWRGEDDVSDPSPLDHIVPRWDDLAEERGAQSPEMVLRHRC